MSFWKSDALSTVYSTECKIKNKDKPALIRKYPRCQRKEGCFFLKTSLNLKRHNSDPGNYWQNGDRKSSKLIHFQNFKALNLLFGCLSISFDEKKKALRGIQFNDKEEVQKKKYRTGFEIKVKTSSR